MYYLPCLNVCQPHQHLICRCLMGANDMFAFVVNFLNANWQLKYITIELFKATKTIGHAMALKL